MFKHMSSSLACIVVYDALCSTYHCYVMHAAGLMYVYNTTAAYINTGKRKANTKSSSKQSSGQSSSSSSKQQQKKSQQKQQPTLAAAATAARHNGSSSNSAVLLDASDDDSSDEETVALEVNTNLKLLKKADKSKYYY
jgi:hypothetical protein